MVPVTPALRRWAWHIGGDALTAHVKDLVAVHAQDSLSGQELSDLLAEAQGMYGPLVRVQGWCHIGGGVARHPLADA